MGHGLLVFIRLDLSCELSTLISFLIADSSHERSSLKNTKKAIEKSSAAVLHGTLTFVLLNPDMSCLFKQCRS